MPEIYLIIDGQQAGPFSPAQVRQFLAEGKVTDATSAWYKDLAEWSTLALVMAKFPAEPPAAPAVPSFVPPSRIQTQLKVQPQAPVAPVPSYAEPAPAKKKMNGCLLAALIFAGIMGALLLGFGILAGIAIGPIQKGIEKAKENASMQQSRMISIAMFQYANDHNGAYPDGKTSTEVFQKLLDEKYASNAADFYIMMPGKVRATGTKLSPENVCFDVTVGATSETPDSLPLVFTTGYTVTYKADGSATLDSPGSSPFPGISVAYKGNSAKFIKAGPDGNVTGVVPPAFDPGDKTYRQLKP